MGTMFHCIYFYTGMFNDVTNLVCERVSRHIAGQKWLLGFTSIAVDPPEAVLLHRILECVGRKPD
ncbi:hypothetical protein SQ11_03125 [Nitrosospira sp. NpAV]|nr:hypothetical protein SQ11_03125 [Nitrosospira sp. NpAV]